MFGRYINWLVHISLIFTRPIFSQGWKNKNSSGSPVYLDRMGRHNPWSIQYRQRLFNVKFIVLSLSKHSKDACNIKLMNTPNDLNEQSYIQKCNWSLVDFWFGNTSSCLLQDQNHNVVNPRFLSFSSPLLLFQ